ncbi:MAG: hypothetical protein RLY78_1821 [Pseudomonadota bacterium]
MSDTPAVRAATAPLPAPQAALLHAGPAASSAADLAEGCATGPALACAAGPSTGDSTRSAAAPAAGDPLHDDVLIVGAGPAGLALACALADLGLRVCVLEQQPLAAIAQPADDGREIALTHRARGVMSRLGLWPALPADLISPLREARVLDGLQAERGLAAALRFGPEHARRTPAHTRTDADARTGQARQTDDDVLGWLVPNHAIRAAAWQAASHRAGIRIEAEARVLALQLPAAAGAAAAAGPFPRPAPSPAPDPALATLTLADGRVLRAALVVAADSRLSTVRRMAGIGAAMHDFGRSVIVAPVAHARDHGGIAWECFRYGNTLALLPLTQQRSSAVVTLPTHAVADWMALDDTAFSARIAQQCGGRLGAMAPAGPRHGYPLVAVYAHRFIAPRFALVGDAAVGMHPVTAHGYNFGLYGIEVLATQLQQALQATARVAAVRDDGAPATGHGGRLAQVPAAALQAALAHYQREHRQRTLPVFAGTQAVVGLYTDERGPARLLRRAVLGIAEHLPPVNRLIKQAVTQQLTGSATA